MAPMWTALSWHVSLLPPQCPVGKLSRVSQRAQPYRLSMDFRDRVVNLLGPGSMFDIVEYSWVNHGPLVTEIIFQL
jgi:hypothetical protein